MSYWEGRWRQYCPIGGHLNFLRVSQKNAKNACFCFRANYSRFWCCSHIQDTTMWKLTSRRFRKCIKNWSGELHTGELHTGSYNPSKMEESEKTGPSPKIRHRKKNNTLPILSFSTHKVYQLWETLFPTVDQLCGCQNSKLAECCFFLRCLPMDYFSWNLTQLWQLITMA